MLTEVTFPLSINTSRDNPIESLFLPGLMNSLFYDVAVGYFSTAWVRDAAEGMAQFAENGGKARWLISPEIQPQDYEAFQKLNDAEQREKIEQLSYENLEKLLFALRKDTKNTFCWLIFKGVIDLRMAFPKTSENGLMHAKMGVFKDGNANILAFNGSYNLTSKAATNWEKIDLYKSWDNDIDRIQIIQNEFEDLWNDRDPKFKSIQLTDAKNLEFVKRTVASSNCPFKVIEPLKSRWDKYKPPQFALDAEEKLRDYQEKALQKWFQSDGLGILAMATGAGKTITALSGVSRLTNKYVSNKTPILNIITVPYQHLAEQWAEDARLFGYTPILCYGGHSNWKSQLRNALLELKSQLVTDVMIITVNDTFSSRNFKFAIEDYPNDICFVADEVHNLGSHNYRQALDERYKYRLGLSATPKRDRDEIGTNSVLAYFKGIIYEFSLADALERKFLTPYTYHVIPCYFTETELTEYRSISRDISKIASRALSGNSKSAEQKYELLLIQRARLVSAIESKLVNLRHELQRQKTSKFNLIYCGDATLDDERQITRVTKLLGNELNISVNKFTSDESIKERKDILRRFETGSLQAIAAIRCLDEGVDVPATQNAYILSSSTNSRQFIQRRGRVLRKSSEKRNAKIVDFLALPEQAGNDYFDRTSIRSSERALLEKELTRIEEFATLAINAGELTSYINGIRERYGLF